MSAPMIVRANQKSEQEAKQRMSLKEDTESIHEEDTESIHMHL